MKLDNIELFIYTMDEYKRFYTNPSNSTLTKEYNEKEYTEIHIKLMLLRKFGNKHENVYVGTVIENAIKKFPTQKDMLEEILEDYNKIEKEQIEYVLSDGTKLNLYETIEDVMYGIYLHADENRIIRLKNSDENLRFACVRKYVEELEKIVFRLYDCIKTVNTTEEEKSKKEKASVIYLGDNTKNKQKIKNSPYWSNLYGYDGNNGDLEKIVKDYGIEEFEIQIKCMAFLEELKKDSLSISALDSLIFPATKKDWGDYSVASSYYKSIKNPGISSKIRYNEEHTMAYVRIFPQVEDIFIIETPHIYNDLHEICLVKENPKSEWKIYSIGGHLDSYIIKNSNKKL